MAERETSRVSTALKCRAMPAVVTCFALLALAGCSGGVSDACSLLSDDEASDVLGVPVHDGELDTDRTIEATYCEWIAEGADTSEGGDEAYTLWISEGSDGRTVGELEEDRASPDAEPIDGLGEDAFFLSDQYGTELKLLVDGRAVTIGVSGDADHPVSERRERSLERHAAELVVERLS